MPGGRSVRVEGPVETPRGPFGAPPPEVLDAHGYVCEEFRVAGDALAYTHAEPDGPGDDGRWTAEPYGEAPYRTRILVVRPRDASACNGTVVLNWQNVSAGYESSAPESGEVYRGCAWVGASVQEVGLHGMPAGRHGVPGGLPLLDADPYRYSDLRHPGEQACFDMFSGAAETVGPRRAEVADLAADPLDGVTVERVIATGGSQSAMRLCAYANAIHALHHVVDGYLLHVWEGRAPHLEDGPLSMYARTTVRDDLDVPVVIVNSEFEVTATHGLALDDHERRRVWEVTGTAHGVSPRARYQRGAEPTPNPVSLQPVRDAALRVLHRWLADGVAPPVRARIAVDGFPARVRRDDDGNGVGGIRLPELVVPIAEHRGRDLRSRGPALFGSARMYDDDALRGMYPSRAEYVARWRDAVDAVVADGVVLPEDAPTLLARGDEIASLLPVD